MKNYLQFQYNSFFNYLFSILCLFGSYKLIRAAFLPIAFALMYDPLFSDDAQQQLCQIITLENCINNLDQLLVAAKARVPAVSALVRTRFSRDNIQLKFIANQPIALINNSIIMDKASTVYSARLIKPLFYSNLLKITVIDLEKVLKHEQANLCSFILQSLPILAKNYAVIWHDKTFIELQSFEQKFKVKITAEQVISQDFLNALNLFYKKRGVSIIDMRFRGYAVVSAE